MPLTDTLAAMLREAKRTGQPQTRNLPRGLRLHVKIINGTTSLGISRAETNPSLSEWRTVIHALPYKIGIRQPATGISSDHRYILYAEWPTPEQEQTL